MEEINFSNTSFDKKSFIFFLSKTLTPKNSEILVEGDFTSGEILDCASFNAIVLKLFIYLFKIWSKI
ncbi:hypothetical protein D3C85_1815140 [compost metagenome]